MFVFFDQNTKLGIFIWNNISSDKCIWVYWIIYIKIEKIYKKSINFSDELINVRVIDRKL